MKNGYPPLFACAAMVLALLPVDTFGVELPEGAKAMKSSEKPPSKEMPEERTERQVSLSSQVVLKVVDPIQVRDALAKEVRKVGGFPIYLDGHSFHCKVGAAKLSAFLQKVGAHGAVVEKSQNREDLTLRIANWEGQLQSKLETLQRLRGFFDDSSVQATLDIERTMNDLVREIEQVRGRLRVLKDRSRWSVVTISFRFRKRDRHISVQSPFPWLNTTGLHPFLETF